jgi:hypothetical protein
VDEMSVESTHPDYDANVAQWELTRDCVEGSNAVKKRKSRYLPKPNPEDKTKQNDDRYSDYLLRANFVNFTGSTLEGMIGMVYREDMQVELQQSVEYLIENVDGSGITLDQMTRSLTGNLLQTGRHGLLVDYPEAPPSVSRADEKALNLRANILSYPAESIINWDTVTIGGVTLPSLVVLEEEISELQDNGFSHRKTKQYRVLKLDEGVYVQRLYAEDGTLKSESTPTKADGSTWDAIPFEFVGAQNNDHRVDKAPLYDISEVNLAHYRNSADYEDACYMSSQPTPYFSGLNQSWVDQNMKMGIVLGSRRAAMLPEGGSAGILQASETTMASKGMEMKEQQMIRLGARLIQDNGGTETAEAARIRYAGQNSKLGAVIGNIEAALTQCLEWAMMYMGGDGENIIKLNKEFYDAKVDPQLITAQIMLLDRGVITQPVLRDRLRDVGMIDKDTTDEELDAGAEENIGM